MKRVTALVGLVWAIGCSFPDYQIQPPNPVVEPNCHDGDRNGGETGIDCGMAACSKTCGVDQGCDTDVDCNGGKCREHVCRAPSCEDELVNGDETDTDCGGENGCKTCTVDQLCKVVGDCDGGECLRGRCQAPSCKDSLLNGTETDQNCGGDCDPCAVGDVCKVNDDCNGVACSQGKCQAASCGDGLLNQDETDEDCGGSCDPCVVGRACKLNDDCDGVACTKNKCQSAACADAILNQDETDKDCGGSCGTHCANGAHCKIAADCESGVCTAQTRLCAAPSCTDGVLNGTEPSLDCGSSCPSQCLLLQTCAVNEDCATGSCVDRRCLPKSASGQTLSPLGWLANASNTFSNDSQPKLVLDGNQGTNWISGIDQAPGLWFQLDMLKDQVFFSLEIDCNDASDCAQSVNISVSHDGNFDAPPVIKDFGTGSSTVITFPKPQVGRYIRLTLAQGKAKWWRIDELRVRQ